MTAHHVTTNRPIAVQPEHVGLDFEGLDVLSGRIEHHARIPEIPARSR
jgi:hypothetical protein